MGTAIMDRTVSECFKNFGSDRGQVDAGPVSGAGRNITISNVRQGAMGITTKGYGRPTKNRAQQIRLGGSIS